LQGIGNTGNHIGFANHAHGLTFNKDELGRKFTNSRALQGSESPTIERNRRFACGV